MCLMSIPYIVKKKVSTVLDVFPIMLLYALDMTQTIRENHLLQLTFVALIRMHAMNIVLVSQLLLQNLRIK